MTTPVADETRLQDASLRNAAEIPSVVSPWLAAAMPLMVRGRVAEFPSEDVIAAALTPVSGSDEEKAMTRALMARAAMERRPSQAVEALTRSAQELPGSRLVLIWLADALRLAGRAEDGLRMLFDDSVDWGSLEPMAQYARIRAEYGSRRRPPRELLDRCCDLRRRGWFSRSSLILEELLAQSARDASAFAEAYRERLDVEGSRGFPRLARWWIHDRYVFWGITAVLIVSMFTNPALGWLMTGVAFAHSALAAHFIPLRSVRRGVMIYCSAIVVAQVLLFLADRGVFS